MKRFLIIGNANHILIKTLCGNLREYYNYNIVVDIFNTGPYLSDEREYYNHIYNINSLPSTIKLITKASKLLNYYIQLRKLPSYDIVHVHYVDIKVVRFSKIIAKKSSKLIASIWGSDYNRSPEMKKKLTPLLDRADYLTFSNVETLRSAVQFYQKYEEKSALCVFGLETFKYIEENSNKTKIDSRMHLGLSPKKRIIAIGNTASKNIQHYEIIESILNSPFIERIRKECQFIFPLTYSNDVTYRENLILYIQSLDLDCKIFAEFLSFKDLAFLRKSCDVLVNVQKVDQLSGAMLEHIFAENIIITGKWLPYQTLYESGVELVIIDKVALVGTALNSYLNGNVISDEILKENKKKVSHFGLWQSCLENWVDIYEK